MEYKTKLGEGRLLLATYDGNPEPVTLNINLTGWHKIFIGFFSMNADNYSFIKLTDDEEYTPISTHTPYL